ncbi:unnamed protein product, partial [Symbiodinium microadriaticum]
MMHCSMGRVAALVAGLVLWTISGLQLHWRELATLSVVAPDDPGPIRLKVLMVRTIGAQEVQFTKDDIRSLADKTKGIQKANTSHCAARKLPGLKAPVSRDLPLDAWPADVVCYAGITDLLIDLHVILLVWEKVGQLDVSDIPLNISVIHAPRTRKLDAWVLHLTATAVAAYDYVWLADGDVKTSDVNWFAFWTNMLYFQPQVAQPAIVAFDKGKIHWRHWRKNTIVNKFHRSTQTRGSDHTVLRVPEDDEGETWAIDPTLIAAEVGIVEIMTPVLTPRAWLAMREALVSNSKAMEWVTKGATWCVDVKWFQLARASVLGLEAAGEPDVSIGAVAQRFLQQQSSYFGELWPAGKQQWDSYEPPSCMVFYQTPVRHHNFQSLKKSAFKHKNFELCRELEVALTNTTLQSVYRTFYESDLREGLGSQERRLQSVQGFSSGLDQLFREGASIQTSCPHLRSDNSGGFFADLASRIVIMRPNVCGAWRIVEAMTIATGSYPYDSWKASRGLKQLQSEWIDGVVHDVEQNHDSILLEVEDRQFLVTVLGRWSRLIQVMDLETGLQWSKRTESDDPDGDPLDNLNHVYTVLVDKLDGGGKEVWLPCGFRGDEVDKEFSIKYMRIFDLETLELRTGPKLPFAGGACTAVALEIVPGEPPMICSFGGTNGHHNSGIFQPYATCYDRLRERFWFPFGKMPYGMDHGSIVVTPTGVCGAQRRTVIILNYRIAPYGSARPEMLAHDLPESGWTAEELSQASMEEPGKWYLYHNVSFTKADPCTSPRDASGMATANGGRFLLNFGGIFYTHDKHGHPIGHRFSAIRSFDVCEKRWTIEGDLGMDTFALQTAASQKLQVAVTCGGESVE